MAPHPGFDTLSRKQHNCFHINSFPFIEISFVLGLEPEKREIPISPLKIGNSHFFIYLLNGRCLDENGYDFHDQHTILILEMFEMSGVVEMSPTFCCTW